MTPSLLYSIRMRASNGTRHLSGVERIVPFGRLNETVRQCLDRAWTKSVLPEQVVLTIEPVAKNDVKELLSLDLVDIRVVGVAQCRELAKVGLMRNGISPEAADKAFLALDSGPSPRGGAMRGAMIMDARTGERLEPDQERGIRASRFDWSDDAFRDIDGELTRMGLGHFRTREALALATKAAYAPGMLAELCWSDDDDYTAGYVASRKQGYIRFPQLRERKAPGGGRSFFVDGNVFDLDAFTRYLTSCPVIITGKGRFRSAQDLHGIPMGK
jgi:6-carboxyhexanoate--CoA ligase